MNIPNTVKSIVKIIVFLIAVAIATSAVVFTSGCTSTEETTPIPLPTSDYKTDICHTWKGIKGVNIDHRICYDFKPNNTVYISTESNSEYGVTSVIGKYDIYDNKILHMAWPEDAIEPLRNEEFWHIRICGEIMYLSVKKINKDGESYVSILVMQQINQSSK